MSIYPNSSGGVTITLRRRTIYLGVVLITMLDSVRRMYGDSPLYSTSMWVMEFLVLALIAYEVYVGITHRKQEQRRKTLVDSHISALRLALAKGQNLLGSSPRGSSGMTDANRPWKESVVTWIDNTRQLLESYSPQAATSFMLDSGAAQTLHYPGVVFMQDHHVLLTRLNNLKAIMEQPNVYF